MDEQNQRINPTLMTKKPKHVVEPRDNYAVQPAATKKHEAYVQKRRVEMEEKKKQTESKFQEEIERFIK